jgi:hypothetical protein
MKDVVGSPKIELKLSCDKPQGMIAVRLCDLRPDGTSALITYGYLNLTHRESHENPTNVPVGTPIQATVILDQIAYRIPKGHRFRVAVSTSYWPSLWPSPETAEIAIEAGHIDIPERPLAVGDEITFEPPEAAPAWQAKELRPASYARSCDMDEETGLTHTRVSCDFGENEDLDHGLTSGGWMKEDWSIHPDDPHSASVTSEWEKTGGREGQMWRTHVLAKMHSDKTDFFLSATVKAYENEVLIFERGYDDKIPRDLV